ncbi:NRDE family protein [Halocatena halophila]|uniref:NRDE family protein n=1 Tax=Halocatena halophila TaxID=2814576 RepID=UPI002ED27670
MCTIVLAYQQFESTPLLIGANRDERYDRPSAPPQLLDESTTILAPRDQSAGGTWIGVNEAGLIVALTNRWGAPAGTGERSRGLLVRDLLDHGDAQSAARATERELDTTLYDGFYLVCADENNAILIENSGGPLIRTLTPGVHVVMNVGYDTSYRIPSEHAESAQQQAANGRELLALLRTEPDEAPASWRDRTATALSNHDRGVCVHGDGFGTRSSSLIQVSDDAINYWFADGPPCETSYDHVDERLR